VTSSARSLRTHFNKSHTANSLPEYLPFREPSGSPPNILFPTDAIARLRGPLLRTHFNKSHIGNALFTTRHVLGMFKISNIGEGITE
jgi:hypothetical protein